MIGLRASSVGYDKVAGILCDDVGTVERDGTPAGAGHLTLVPVVVQEAIGQDEPALLITLQKIVKVGLIKGTFAKSLAKTLQSMMIVK